MAEHVNASQLRQDIYRLLDRVLETGEPLEIERRGRHLRVVAVDEQPARLQRISGNRDAIVGDPEELVRTDWSADWHGDQMLDS